MTSSAVATPGGILFNLNGPTEGVTILIPPDWSLAKIERHIKELEDWLS